MGKKNNYIYIILAGLGIYYLLNKTKPKGSIIVDPSQSIKPYAQANSVLYDNDLNTPIYTFNVDTLINLLDQDTERGIYRIEFKSETFGTITGFISQYKIIYK
jgi:hypothetical protein